MALSSAAIPDASVFHAACSMLTGRKTSLYRVSRRGFSPWVLARRIWDQARLIVAGMDFGTSVIHVDSKAGYS